MRGLAHRMVDDMLDYLQDVRQRPVWQPPSPEAAAALRQPLPQEGAGAGRAYRRVV